MRFFYQIQTDHDDIIHDVAFDFYGKRLATVSSDQNIKVWDQDDSGGWILSAEWKGHTGSIWKVAWAHPEFGQVLASCSFDCSVLVWEEEENAQRSADPNDAPPAWQKKASLVDSRESVVDVKFAPRHLGLRLGACSSDGIVRMYEATDIMNLHQWQLTDTLEVYKGSCTALSWNPSHFHPPMFAVGGGSGTGGSEDPTVTIWEYDDAARKWHSIEALTGHDDTVHDVAWAPNMGRSYELIATACKDGYVRIWQLHLAADRPQVDAHCVASFESHNAEVWRVEWNITGTILASSGDDGTVRLWKRDFGDEWVAQAVISGSEDGAAAAASGK